MHNSHKSLHVNYVLKIAAEYFIFNTELQQKYCSDIGNLLLGVKQSQLPSLWNSTAKASRPSLISNLSVSLTGCYGEKQKRRKEGVRANERGELKWNRKSSSKLR